MYSTTLRGYFQEKTTKEIKNVLDLRVFVYKERILGV